MSIFGKKWEGEHSGTGRHGIGDVIRLLRSLPVDQHPELVVQVIRTTLEALEVVHVSDLVQDAVSAAAESFAAPERQLVNAVGLEHLRAIVRQTGLIQIAIAQRSEILAERRVFAVIVA